MNNHDNVSEEIKDIVEMIKRYNASHNNSCFIFSFVGFEKDMENTCECGRNCDKISDHNTLSGAKGDLWVLRDMLNCLRDMIEDNIDEEGYVNF